MIYSILFSENLTAKDAVICFLITIFVYMISLTIHEFSHAFVAYKMGDPTAKEAGRLTLNPIKHFNLLGFVFFVFLGIGWANPVPVNPLNYKKFKKGTRLVSIAGIISNFLMGLIAAVIHAILMATVGLSGGVAMDYVYMVLTYSMLINSFLAMFNFLPIPPLDGFAFIESFAKPNNKYIKFANRNGFRILIGVLFVGMLTDLFFGFDIFEMYLSLLNNFVYFPIAWLGVLWWKKWLRKLNLHLT